MSMPGCATDYLSLIIRMLHNSHCCRQSDFLPDLVKKPCRSGDFTS